MTSPYKAAQEALSEEEWMDYNTLLDKWYARLSENRSRTPDSVWVRDHVRHDLTNMHRERYAELVAEAKRSAGADV